VSASLSDLAVEGWIPATAAAMGDAGRGAEVRDRQAVLGAQALGDERAAARLRIMLDAEQGGRRVVREFRHERAEVERVEGSPRVRLPAREGSR
jgi:hypothetical protein